MSDHLDEWEVGNFLSSAIKGLADMLKVNQVCLQSWNGEVSGHGHGHMIRQHLHVHSDTIEVDGHQTSIV